MKYQVKRIEKFSNSTVESIVALLNESFSGEFHFSTDWFNWKHVNSCYGLSLAWGVYYEMELVGIRLYSRWHDFGRNEFFVQAVDTATHPDHQRKGLFALLIKESLKYLNENNLKIFNFPNANSYNQYLKYGWKDSRNISWNVCFLPSVSVLGKVKKSNKVSKLKIDMNFINWRFVNNPCHDYLIFYGEESVVVFKKSIKFIPYYQIVYVDYCSVDSFALHSFLLRNKIFIAMYITTDYYCDELARDFFLMVIRTRRGFNFVTRDVDGKLGNVSLSDTDFI